jgi:hypothetical protein
MGDAFQCDRCFKFEEGRPVAGVTFKLPNPHSTNTSATRDESAELCPECMAALRDWRDELKPGARP